MGPKSPLQTRCGIILIILVLAVTQSVNTELVMGQVPTVKGRGLDLYYCPVCKRNVPGSHYHFQQARSAPSGPPAYQVEAQHLNDEGLQFFNNNDFTLAFDTFRAALDKWPDNQAIRENLDRAAAALAAAEEKKHTAAARERLAQFEKIKQNILSNFKGISENELELKSAGRSDSGLVLKSMERPSPAPVIDSSVVDLRHLDPDRPIIIDPNIVKGRERNLPVQIDPETFKNANYNKGFDALMHFDPYSAVNYFQQARKERPQDLLVRNALLLAQDLVKVRQIEEREEKVARANSMCRQAVKNLMEYDPGHTWSAIVYLRAAYGLNPGDRNIRNAMDFVEGMFFGQVSDRRRDPAIARRDMEAYRKAFTSLESISSRDYASAYRIMKQAQRISPDNPNINRTLDFVDDLKLDQELEKH